MSTREAQPTEEELRASYEAELSRITTGDMILQTAASLLNIGGLRLGLVGGEGSSPKIERDLEQVRDAIDGVRALLPILERHSPEQLRPLRDALSQLQMAYTRELQAEGSAPASSEQAPAGEGSSGGDQSAGGEKSSAGKGSASPPPKQPPASGQSKDSSKPGPAESSGRLWVPGR